MGSCISSVPVDSEGREHQYWLSRVKRNGKLLVRAPEHIRNNKRIVLAAIRQDGFALAYASFDLKNDTAVVMTAVSYTIESNCWAIRLASPELQNDKKFVTKVVQKHGLALEYVVRRLRNDTGVVMAAIQENGKALRYASPELQNHKEVALAALKQNTDAFKYISQELQKDIEVALFYIKANPDNIKHVPEDIKRNPELLIAAGMFDMGHDSIRRQMDTKKIALSTRFSLNPTSISAAIQFTKYFKEHEYIRKKKFKLYAPNAFDKQTCDPDWTNRDHPCRGTKDTCQYDNVLTNAGHPTDDCCWRYSFRHQLEEAKSTGGFMLQLVERGEGNERQELGNGQMIEWIMAQQLEVKVFQVYRPTNKFGSEYSFNERHIDEVVVAIKDWYEENQQQDMSLCLVRPTQ